VPHKTVIFVQNLAQNWRQRKTLNRCER